jgi:hypothetical protein
MAVPLHASPARASFLRGVFELFLAPASAFAILREGRGWGWKAFVAIAAAQALAVWLFLASMPSDWLASQQMQQMGELSGPQREQVQARLETMAPHLGVLSAGSTVIGAGLLVLALGSSYWLLAALFAPRRPRWGEWQRLAIWTQWPSLLHALGLVVIALASEPQRPMALLQFGSLNELLLHWPPGHPHQHWASALSVFALWSALLAIPGWRQWTGVGPLRATLLALAPYLLVFGVWGVLS